MTMKEGFYREGGNNFVRQMFSGLRNAGHKNEWIRGILSHLFQGFR